MNEARCSWNSNYVSPDGWTCMLTIRADSPEELFAQVALAVSLLTSDGCVPSDRHGNPTLALPQPVQANGNGHQGQPVPAQPNGHAAPTGNNGQPDPSYCPIHGVTMKRWQKDNRSWYSHKTDEGWCNGKAK